MDSLRKLLHEHDRMPVPDLWPTIQRTESPFVRTRVNERSRPAMIAGLVVGGGVLLLLSGIVLVRDDGPPPSNSGTPASPTVSTPAMNGLVAFARGTAAPEGEAPRTFLVTLDPTTGDALQFAPMDSSTTPAWSPDGTRLAYVSNGDLVVQIVGARRSELLVACRRPACQGQGSPAWAPDGTRLAFWADRERNEGLWVVNADGSGLRLLVRDVSFGPPAWSPDGQTIAVSGSTLNDIDARGIYLIDSSDGEVIRKLEPRALDPQFVVTWAPDGRSLAFDAVGEGGALDGAGIYAISPEGTNLRLLTACSTHDFCTDSRPAWAPDGTSIVFTRSAADPGSDGSIGDIYLLSIESGEVLPLTDGDPLDCCPSWQSIR